MATTVFDWSDYLALAQRLAANSDEASHRTAISRAYYCAYHKASEWAVAKGYVDQKKHYELWNFYASKPFDKARMKLSIMGNRMKKERVDADYRLTAARMSQRMTVQLQKASEFLSELSALP